MDNCTFVYNFSFYWWLSFITNILFSLRYQLCQGLSLRGIFIASVHIYLAFGPLGTEENHVKHIPRHVTQKDEKRFLSNFTETKCISLIRSVLGNVGTWHANYVNFQLSEDSCWLIQCWLFSTTWLLGFDCLLRFKKKKRERCERGG